MYRVYSSMNLVRRRMNSETLTDRRRCRMVDIGVVLRRSRVSLYVTGQKSHCPGTLRWFTGRILRWYLNDPLGSVHATLRIPSENLPLFL